MSYADLVVAAATLLVALLGAHAALALYLRRLDRRRARQMEAERRERRRLAQIRRIEDMDPLPTPTESPYDPNEETDR